jgi:mRNA interferase RelE/StbE
VTYELRVLPRAERQLGRLDRQIYQKIKAKFQDLRTDARPPSSVKLKERDGWRIRSGDYRILYDIDDTSKVITILEVGHRREIYR